MILLKNKYISFNTETKTIKNIYQRIKNGKAWIIKLLLEKENNKENRNNIYEILNDFKIDRTEKNLIGFNYIGIDLDYFEWTVEDIIRMSKEELKISPSKINKTFKGYHVFFKLNHWLYEMDKEQYKKLYKIINEKLWWDTKMRSITAILKVENYIDYKENREFKIKNEYIDYNNEINEEDVYNLIKEKIIFERRLEKKEKKEKIKSRNVKMINEIDGFEFIKGINDSWIFKQITIRKNDFIDNTSGLQIFKGEIRDHSWKGRMWNWNFLFKYLIPENKIKLKDNKVFFIKLSNVLNKTFWIKLKKGTTKDLPIYNHFFNNWINNNKFSLEKDIEKDIDKEILNDFNEMILNNDKKGWIKKIYIAINMLANEKNENLNKGIEILESDLLKKMNISIKTKNKKEIRQLLFLLSSLKFESIKEVNWIEYKVYKNLFDFWINKSKHQSTKYHFKSNIKVKKVLWIKKDIALLKVKNKIFNFLIDVESSISNFGSFNINIEKFKKENELETKRPYKRKIKELQKYYNIKETETTLYFKNK